MPRVLSYIIYIAYIAYIITINIASLSIASLYNKATTSIFVEENRAVNINSTK
jgi:hypothetical protein